MRNKKELQTIRRLTRKVYLVRLSTAALTSQLECVNRETDHLAGKVMRAIPVSWSDTLREENDEQ